MLKIIKSKIFIFIMTAIVFSIIGVKAATYYQAEQIEYSPTNTSWKVSNVSEALNSLYENKSSGWEYIASNYQSMSNNYTLNKGTYVLFGISGDNVCPWGLNVTINNGTVESNYLTNTGYLIKVTQNSSILTVTKTTYATANPYIVYYIFKID